MQILKNLFRTRKKFNGQLKQEHRDRIVPAFVHDGVQYYMFDDILRMPTSRGLHALDLYDEFNMRCTKEFLKKHCEAIAEICSAKSGKLDLMKLAILNKNLQERLTMLPVPDHIFRLAAVVFFDDTENPYMLDRKYCDDKVKRWKANETETLGFFLRTPLRDLIPFLALENVNLHTYSATMNQVNELHLKTVLSELSAKGTKADM